MPAIEFSTGDPDEVAGALTGLVNANLATLRGGYKPDLERLRRLRYVEDPPDTDLWITLPRLLERGAGDCEDLASAWCAVLMHGGVDCTLWIAVLRPYKRRYHAYVRVPRRSVDSASTASPFGRLFDPSVVGGMRALPMSYYAPDHGRRVAGGGCNVVGAAGAWPWERGGCGDVMAAV